MYGGLEREHYARWRRTRRGARVDRWRRKRIVPPVDRTTDVCPDMLFSTVDVVVYTAILGASMVPMLFFGRAWAIVALVGLIAAWGSPRVAASMLARLRRWLSRR